MFDVYKYHQVFAKQNIKVIAASTRNCLLKTNKTIDILHAKGLGFLTKNDCIYQLVRKTHTDTKKLSSSVSIKVTNEKLTKK